MFDSKRRPASTQAVSRKVEGIEPRNQVKRKDDGVKMCGSQHRHNRKGEGVSASSENAKRGQASDFAILDFVSLTPDSNPMLNSIAPLC